MEILIEVYGEQRLPPILLLPTGTQNMVPRSFGIEGSGLANLMLATLRYRHNMPMRCIRRNMLKVNGHISFMFGIGVAARFMEKYYESGQTNPVGAAKLLAKLVASTASNGDLGRYIMQRLPCHLTLDGEQIQTEANVHTMFASFVERLPLHFVLFPRCGADEGVFYGITAYSLRDDLATMVDQLVLPQSVRPFRAVRMGDLFAFSIEANYSSGGLLGRMGTYLGTGDGPFTTLVREPSAQVAGKNGVYIIKSRASYFVIDVNRETYSILVATNRCVDYGEYPASEGTCSNFVTFATVKDAQTGYPSAVTVRSFAL